MAQFGSAAEMREQDLVLREKQFTHSRIETRASRSDARATEARSAEGEILLAIAKMKKPVPLGPAFFIFW
jgi:hypothetical protein